MCIILNTAFHIKMVHTLQISWESVRDERDLGAEKYYENTEPLNNEEPRAPHILLWTFTLGSLMML